MGQIGEKGILASGSGLVIFMLVMTALFICVPKTQVAAGSDEICFDKTKKGKTAVTVRKNKSVYPKHKPYGKGVGAKPGRVVWSHNPKSVQWDGKGYWWGPGHFNKKVIAKMFRNSIASLGGAKKAKTGWQQCKMETEPFQRGLYFQHFSFAGSGGNRFCWG